MLAKLDKEWPLQEIFRTAIPYFHIRHSGQHDTPILIQKPRPGAPTGYWDDPVNVMKPGAAELAFIAYFDWDAMDYIDLKYYRVRIMKFDAHPELIGREALIERQYCRVTLSLTCAS